MERGGARTGATEPHYALLRILAETTALPDAAMRLSELVAMHFGWQVGGLWVADEAAGLLRYSGGWAEDDADLAAFRQVCERLTFTRGVGLPGAVWESGEPVWIPELATAPNFPRVEPATRAGLDAAVAVPLTSPGGVLGVLELMARGVRAPDPAELGFLGTIGREIGQYVARTGAEERLHLSEEMSAAIVQAALDCIITMDHEGRITDFNAAAEATFGFKREDVVGRPLAEVVVPPALREAHRGALRRYVETRQATILNRRLELEAVRADGTIFPVELTVTRLGRREPPVFGGFIRDITDRRSGEEQVARLLESEHAARVRAEHAERLTRTVADTLQRGLLPPRLPEIPGVQLGAAYRAGAEGTLVGGDFYDVFELGEGRWGFAIGDVRGKGAQAASVTSMMRWTIRTAALREDSPIKVLEVLNTPLHGEATDADYCTAIYGSLEAGSGGVRLRLAIAGHPLPLVRRASGEVSPVGDPGTLLGALPRPRLHETELALRDGDVLLFYTDGVTETRTAEGFFGTERLAAVLEACGDADADTIARTIVTAVARTASRGITDDIALLVVRAG